MILYYVTWIFLSQWTTTKASEQPKMNKPGAADKRKHVVQMIPQKLEKRGLKEAETAVWL